MLTKSIIKSKTIWANLVFLALAAIANADPNAVGLTAEQWLIVSALVNFALRYVTKQGVTLSKQGITLSKQGVTLPGAKHE